MDRQIVYPQENPIDLDILSSNKDGYVGLGRFIDAVLGEDTQINGLVCEPTSPASLGVNVTPGEIYILEETDPDEYGDPGLAADSNPLMKQGIYYGSQTPFVITPPGTADFSQDFLFFRHS